MGAPEMPGSEQLEFGNWPQPEPFPVVDRVEFAKFLMAKGYDASTARSLSTRIVNTFIRYHREITSRTDDIPDTKTGLSLQGAQIFVGTLENLPLEQRKNMLGRIKGIDETSYNLFKRFVLPEPEYARATSEQLAFLKTQSIGQERFKKFARVLKVDESIAESTFMALLEPAEAAWETGQMDDTGLVFIHPLGEVFQEEITARKKFYGYGSYEEYRAETTISAASLVKMVDSHHESGRLLEETFSSLSGDETGFLRQVRSLLIEAAEEA